MKEVNETTELSRPTSLMPFALMPACWWTVDPQNGDTQTLIEEVAGEASSGYAPIVNSYGMVGDRSISDGKQV